MAKWSQFSPQARQRHYLRNSARARALTRLRMRHPDEFAELLAEELAEGPIFSQTQPVDAVTSGNGANGADIHSSSTPPIHREPEVTHRLLPDSSTGLLATSELRKHTDVSSQFGRQEVPS